MHRYRQVLKTQPNHLASLAEWLSVCLWTKRLWIRILLQSFLALKTEFSKAAGFSRMLKDLKYFHFRLFWDKTNDFIFLKSPERFLTFLGILPKIDFEPLWF